MNDKNVLIFGSDNKAPPFSFIDEESGVYKGLVIDYMKALSIEMGTEIVCIPYSWNDALVALYNNETDICDMYPGPTRKSKYIFTKPIYRLRSVCLYPKSAHIKNFKELQNKKIAVQKGDYANEYLLSELDLPDIVPTNNIEESIALLKQKKVDAIVGDEAVINYFLALENLADDYDFLPSPLFQEEVCLAVVKDNEMLRNILNKAIDNLETEKFVEKIQQKWFGISTSMFRENIYGNLKVAIAMTAFGVPIVLVLIIFWNISLKREVNIRTKDLILSKNKLEVTFDSLSDYLTIIDCNMEIKAANLSLCKYLGIGG